MNKNYFLKKNKFISLKDSKKIFKDNFYTKKTINFVVNKYKNYSRDELFKKKINIKIGGRIILKRKIGKVIFITLQDILNKIQIYLSYNFLLKHNFYNIINIGDIVGIIGNIFKTKVGELSIYCNNIYILSKCLKKLPDKFKGLLNYKIKSEKRYLDLISNSKSKYNFVIRSKIILEIRNFLTNNNFIEVETPILQNIPGGADANPFITKIKKLNKNFYLRISPELYLKKLIVGGFNKIFEIGKNFRNEGISCNHNQEFTMLEMYLSYTNYKNLMKFIQKMIRSVCINVFNNLNIKFDKNIINFGKKYDIISMKDSIYKFNNINNLNIDNINECCVLAKSLNIDINNSTLGKIQQEIFKKTVENNLIQPTFIIKHPIDISPLSKRNNINSNLADRFELFINGIEIANGFSELNDFEDQLNRFVNQKNNNLYDKNYIDSLKYGLPPTSGVGIGIDRLIMLLTNTHNIRDIILFPITRYKNI